MSGEIILILHQRKNRGLLRRRFFCSLGEEDKVLKLIHLLKQRDFYREFLQNKGGYPPACKRTVHHHPF